MSSEQARNILQATEREAEKLGDFSSDLEYGFVGLGFRLLEVAELRYWQVQYEKFRDYVQDLAPKCGKTPDQLHRYFLTVRDLSDTFTKEQLQLMGITKAMFIRGKKDYLVIMPQEVVDAAVNPDVTVAELKEITSKFLNEPEDEGDWMDLGAEFYVSAEERATLEDAIKSAMHTDPVIKLTNSKSAQMKDVVLRWAMEFLGSHGSGE